jgi:outer membrane protein assembly factor BamB
MTMTTRLHPRRMASGLAIAALAAGLGACATLESLNPFGSSDDRDRLPGERVAVFPRERDVGVDPALANRPVPAPAAIPVSAWPNPGGNAQNLGGNIGAQTGFSPVWSINAGEGTSKKSAITAPPVIGGGMIFVLDAASTVRAFDQSSGGLLWEASVAKGDGGGGGFFGFFESTGDAPEEGFGGGVAYANGRVFVTTGFREVRALDASSGAQVWAKQMDAPVRAAPVADGGRLYAIDRDNKFVALDQGNGGVIWRHEVFAETAAILGSSNVAATPDMVVVPYTNGDLYAMRAGNGRQMWSDSLTRTGGGDTLSTINDIAGRPVIDGGVVYAISHAGRFVAIDMLSGERIWTRDIAGVQTPWVAGSFIYVLSTSGNLVAIEKATGRAAWITYLGRWEDEEDREDPIDWSGPVMIQGRLVVTSSDGRMLLVNVANGGIEAQYALDDRSFIAPVVAGDVLYLLTDDGVLTAYR